MSWVGTSRRRRLTFLNAALATPKLSAVMSLLFVSLSIPILLFILVYHYNRTSAAILATLHEQIAKARVAAIDSAQNLIQPVANTLRLLAEVAASDPAVFRTEQSRELLYRALTSAEQIDAIYVSFEDGYHRVVTRMDDNRRRSDPRIQQSANWHSSYIDDFSAGPNRRRHRTFFDTWPHVVGEYAVETALDIRTLPHYKDAKTTGALAVTEVSINPDTGYPVLSLGFPVLRNGHFIGFAGANITVDILSRFLDRHRASPQSTTIIADQDGAIIAYPDSAKQVRVSGGRLEVARVQSIADDDLREASRRRTQLKADHFLFRSPGTGRELSASFDGDGLFAVFGAPVRMWMVRRLDGESALELPSPVSDLVVLASTMEVRLRPLRGKQIVADMHPATLVKLGAAGAELDTDYPLEVFDAVQVILPPQTGILAALDSKVMTVTERTAGPRTAFVRFGGLDWDVRARLEVLSRAGEPRA